MHAHGGNGTSNFAPGTVVIRLPVAVPISAFTAIAWYNVLALNVVIWLTFKRRSGLYFYTLLIASWGIAFHELGFLMMFFNISKSFAASMVVITVGWYSMVTGQSLVLYSRLHLIVRDSKKLRWVLYMIIGDALLVHIPTTVFFIVAHYNKELASSYTIWERIQVTIFSIQECIISFLYIYETHKLLKPSEIFQKEKVRRVMRHLIYVNAFVIVLDIAILCIQYANLFNIQVIFKGSVYSVKLFVEFFILNQLMDIASSGVGNKKKVSSTSWLSDRETQPSNGGGGGAGITLDSLEATGSRDSGAAPSRPGKDRDGLGYSSFAGSGEPIQGLDPDNKGLVVKTTEIVVDISKRGTPWHINKPLPSVSGEGDGASSGPVDTASTKYTPARLVVGKRAKQGSVSSSELEFVGRGY